MFIIKLHLILLIVISVSIISEGRLRYKLRKRPECRDKGPRRHEDLPDVVLTGFVQQIYHSYESGEIYSGSILVKRVLKGPKRLEDNQITVNGFGDTELCHSNIRKRDTWLFLLTDVPGGAMKLNGTLLKVSLQNLDRLNALVKGKFESILN